MITVPEKARTLINRMTVPGETGEELVAELESLAASLDSPANFAFHIDPPYYPPWEIDADHVLVRSLQRAYEIEAGRAPVWAYTAFGDASLFAEEAGIPTVQVGATGSRFHESDEWVSIASIARTVRLLVRMTIDLLPAS